ncbi:MAG: lipoyl(octanoyl) transferase LipB [Armatimonadota bacterium]|nr:lipoyl(octanoyl) transferase LipB [Armatimonadota bacterium]MDR7444494.1 lipoyl(octanoyl) transferase LipB [Armatimonadota bacterium]MDR7570804.1 lipoyl(octanoyl) transferase LipB [Armatimonadota bacterium]MDR7615201.1 lipoyl(octanoyl) transferase LipB [Armatimonadota bacterium]
MPSRTVWRVDLPGLADYGSTWELQRELVSRRQRGEVPDVLLLLEHPPVITCGRATKPEHLPIPRERLERMGFRVFDIERGGSVTYHGPGQLVGYPILDLRGYGENVVGYVRMLEESVIRALRPYGIEATRRPGFPGVWVGEEKIAAVGVAVKRRVTMHGFALNVNTDLDHFRVINPCGIGYTPTSVEKLLGRPVPLEEVREAYARAFGEVFHVALEPLPLDRLPWPQATLLPVTG